jgi:hypothetical protein
MGPNHLDLVIALKLGQNLNIAVTNYCGRLFGPGHGVPHGILQVFIHMLYENVF